MPELTHGSVLQVLEVLKHVRSNHERGIPMPAAYHDAVRDVSNRHRVTYQTIGDFRRRLGFPDVNVYLALIDRWLRGDGSPLKDVIRKHSSPGVRALVDQFFVSRSAEATPVLAGPTRQAVAGPQTPARVEEIRLRVAADLMKKLHLAQLAGIGGTLEESAIQLITLGFDASKSRVRQYLDAAVGAT